MEMLKTTRNVRQIGHDTHLTTLIGGKNAEGRGRLSQTLEEIYKDLDIELARLMFALTCGWP